SSLSAVGEVFFKSCSASLHLPCSASERLCFAAVAGSTPDAFCGAWATATLLAISPSRVNVLAYRMDFIKKIKMGQVIVRLPHYTCSALRLVVQLQSELDVSWRLRALNQAHAGANSRIGSVEVDVVEGVEVVASEL